VLIVNSYHEMPGYEAMLNRIFAALKPGGRLVLVEPWARARRAEPRADQVKDHLIAPELAEEELRRAGFTITRREDDFLTREGSPEWLIQASRPDRASPEPR
jgi:predicted methyltransferase